jgi:IS5 family transposase
MENRNGLVVDLQMDVADGRAERRNALDLVDDNIPGTRRITLAGDKGYDTRDFVADCRARNITPHVAQNITKHRGSMIDGRTANQPGYAVSQRVRKRVEEIFGRIKTVGGFRKTRYVGLGPNQLAAHILAAAFNLLRIAKLSEAV